MDTFEGTEGDDTFEAGLGLGIDGLVGVQTLQEADVLVGGDGEDTLNATLNGTGAGGEFAAPSITDIEILNLTARDSALGQDAGLDLFNSTGYTQIWNIGSNNDLTVVNVRESAAIGLDGVVGGTEYGIDYTSSADTTVQNVIANAVGTSETTGQADLDIDAPNGIDTLNLQVSNTVRLHLEDDAANMSVFNISGTGITELSADDNFGNLEELDATGYNGDLELDVNGSTILTSVATNGGDDFINVNTAAVDGDLAVDLGAGADTLSLDNAPFQATMDEGDINALDFDGGVTGVETLSFEDTVELGGAATLDMTGISDDLQVLEFTDGGINGNGNDLTLANSPIADLTVNSTDIDDLNLNADGSILNLDVNTSAGDLDIDGVSAPALETLDLNQAGSGTLWLDITSDATHDVSALQSISANAAGDADVDLLADNADADMDALTNVDVTANGDAELRMTGLAGTAAVFGVQQVEEIEIDVIGAGGFTNPSVGSFDFTSGDLPGGVVTTPYNSAGYLGFNDFGAADDVASALSGVPGLSASATGLTDIVTVVWDDFGPKDPLNYFGGTATTGGINSVTTNTVTTGVLPVDAIPGEGFNGLQTVVVDAGENANVVLTDVRGAFTLEVNAEGTEGVDDGLLDTETTVNVNLTNTGVTEATINGGDEFDYVTDGMGNVTGLDDIDFTVVSVGGALDNFGNPNLVSLTVEGAAADVTLADDLSSFDTLDLTGAANWFSVDASAAGFAPDAGDYITYLIGGTESEFGGATALGGDSQITMAVARETVTFTAEDFGTVVLNNFEAGDDPATGDRIDLSQLGFTNNGQITFEVGEYDAGTGAWIAGGDESDVRITDLAGGPEMSGEIIVTTDIGGAGDGLSDDLSQYNMTYA